jgi:nucleotide-binding universal stress UspA family protein
MKVLVGIAESHESDAVISAIKRFPWPAETEIRVLCVSEKVHPSMLELMGTTVRDVQRKEDFRASVVASAAAVELRDAGFAADTETAEGDPKVEIVESAKRWAADLIVVGSEAGGRLKRVLLGSVATAVVTHADCSVLVIRRTSRE